MKQTTSRVKAITVLAFLVLCPACNGKSETPTPAPSVEAEQPADSPTDNLSDSDQQDDRSLNEIRFQGWTDSDFFDNDYLRAFRQYIDAWLGGKQLSESEMDPTDLEPYRQRLRGKFVVGDVEEFMMGGLLYTLIPVDDPDLALIAWIYSDVDDDNNHVGGYTVYHIAVEEGSGLTKEAIQQFLTEFAGQPMAKLW